MSRRRSFRFCWQSLRLCFRLGGDFRSMATADLVEISPGRQWRLEHFLECGLYFAQTIKDGNVDVVQICFQNLRTISGATVLSDGESSGVSVLCRFLQLTGRTLSTSLLRSNRSTKGLQKPRGVYCFCVKLISSCVASASCDGQQSSSKDSGRPWVQLHQDGCALHDHTQTSRKYSFCASFPCDIL